MSLRSMQKGGYRGLAFLVVVLGAALLVTRIGASQSGSSGAITAIVGAPAQAYVGVHYSQGLQYMPSSVPVSYAITNGAGTQLGLTMTVGLSASVSGTPTGTGTALWTLKASPSGGGAPITRVWSVSVNPVPSQATATAASVVSAQLER
jgi:hypothetical protein